MTEKNPRIELEILQQRITELESIEVKYLNLLNQNEQNRIEFQHIFTELQSANEEFEAQNEELQSSYAELEKKDSLLRANEAKFRSLYESMNEGICLHELVYNDNNETINYRILDVNPRYETILNLHKQDILGKLATEVYNTDSPPYLDIYEKVAQTGTPAHIETYFPPMDKYFDISIFSPGKNMFATIFSDITSKKRTEIENATLRTISDIFLNTRDLADTYSKICDTLYANFQFDVVIVERYDMQTSEIEFVAVKGVPEHLPKTNRIPFSKSFYNVILETGEPITLLDIGKNTDPKTLKLREDRIETFISVPIKIKGEVFGAITLADTVNRIEVKPIITILTTVVNNLAMEIERRQTEIELYKYNILFQAVIKQAPFAAHVLEGGFNNISVIIENAESRRIMGEDLEGRNEINAGNNESLTCRFFTPDGKTEVPLSQMPSPRAFKGEIVTNEHFLFRHSDGEEIIVEANASPVYNINQHIMAVVVTFHDITQLHNSINSLKESEEKIKSYVENAPDGIFVADESGHYIEINKAACTITGYPKEELLGMNFINLIHPEDIQKAEEHFMRCVSTGWSTGDIRYITKSGETKTWTVEAVKLSDTRYLGFVKDITLRIETKNKLKSSIQEKETLLRELYHRTKNNMQVITSILQIQAMMLHDRKVTKVVTDTIERIQAISLVHQMLYKSDDLSSIMIDGYIHELVALLTRSYNINNEISIEHEIEPITILIDLAIPCGLILNELITNSIKHAFPSDTKGIIKIILKRKFPDTLYIEYSDNGKGLDPDFDIDNAETLGIMTIRNIIEHQLDGTVSFNSGAGFSCIITIKDSLYTKRI